MAICHQVLVADFPTRWRRSVIGSPVSLFFTHSQDHFPPPLSAFWRDDKLRQAIPTLIEQMAVCVQFNFSDGKTLISECLNSLTGCVDDDTLLKTINLDVLMHTRSEDHRVRLLALSCSELLWRAHGTKLLGTSHHPRWSRVFSELGFLPNTSFCSHQFPGFVAETTSFMAECAEDENDSVVKQSHQLKNAVENVAGNVDGL